jgi:biopolymer transport protein ExbD
MNSSQVRAKARMAMKRREEEIENEEMEGGELNLVPYLDIVTNIMLFLLATITAGFILGNIDSALPEYSSGGAAGNQDDSDKPLGLIIQISSDKMTLFGTGVTPGDPGSAAHPFVEISNKLHAPEYDFDCTDRGKPTEKCYGALNKAATQIIQDRYKGLYPLTIAKDPDTGKKGPLCQVPDKTGKMETHDASDCRPNGATQVIMLADPEIPYHVVVGVMDALRENQEVDPATKKPKYDAPDNILFPEMIFGTGVQQ